MEGLHKLYYPHTIYNPVDHDGTVASDMVSMKGFDNCDIHISVGVAGNTCVVTLDKDVAVGGSGTTTLAFTNYYVTGIRIPINTWNGTAWTTAGETVTGASLSATFAEFTGSELLMYDWNGSSVVNGELLTGGTSTATALAEGTAEYEDVLIKRTATGNAITMSNINNIEYIIPITAAMLGDGYDCFHVDFADPSGAAQVQISVVAIFTNQRYGAYPAPISSIYD